MTPRHYVKKCTGIQAASNPYPALKNYVWDNNDVKQWLILLWQQSFNVQWLMRVAALIMTLVSCNRAKSCSWRHPKCVWIKLAHTHT